MELEVSKEAKDCTVRTALAIRMDDAAEDQAVRRLQQAERVLGKHMDEYIPNHFWKGKSLMTIVSNLVYRFLLSGVKSGEDLWVRQRLLYRCLTPVDKIVVPAVKNGLKALPAHEEVPEEEQSPAVPEEEEEDSPFKEGLAAFEEKWLKDDSAKRKPETTSVAAALPSKAEVTRSAKGEQNPVVLLTEGAFVYMQKRRLGMPVTRDRAFEAQVKKLDPRIKRVVYNVFVSGLPTTEAASSRNNVHIVSPAELVDWQYRLRILDARDAEHSLASGVKMWQLSCELRFRFGAHQYEAIRNGLKRLFIAWGQSDKVATTWTVDDLEALEFGLGRPVQRLVPTAEFLNMSAGSKKSPISKQGGDLLYIPGYIQEASRRVLKDVYMPGFVEPKGNAWIERTFISPEFLFEIQRRARTLQRYKDMQFSRSTGNWQIQRGLVEMLGSLELPEQDMYAGVRKEIDRIDARIHKLWNNVD